MKRQRTARRHFLILGIKSVAVFIYTLHTKYINEKMLLWKGLVWCCLFGEFWIKIENKYKRKSFINIYIFPAQKRWLVSLFSLLLDNSYKLLSSRKKEMSRWLNVDGEIIIQFKIFCDMWFIQRDLMKAIHWNAQQQQHIYISI